MSSILWYQNGYNIAKAPLYFVRSGFAYIKEGHWMRAGLESRLWSASAITYTSSTEARSAYINVAASEITPSGSNNRWAGFALSCLQNFLTIYN